MPTSNYVSTNRSKHYLKCHLIFVCKYRKAVLVGQLNDDVKHIFESIASNSDFDIEVMETDRDHVHFSYTLHSWFVYLSNSSKIKTRKYPSNMAVASNSAP